MIDFRYHLVSIVAVFLALGIGILMGSLVLGEALVDQLRNDLKGIERTNDQLRDRTVELRTQLETDEQFALAARPYLIEGLLEGEQVVLFAFEGTEGAVLEEMRSSIADSGGVVATTVTLRDKLAVASAAEHDELALLIGSEAASTSELQSDAGAALGSSWAAASESPGGIPADRVALARLVGALEDGGYVDVDSAEEEPLAPPNAMFAIAGGAQEAAPFEVTEVALPLGRELSADGAGVVVAEPSTSVWDFVDSFRDSADVSSTVSTVDQAESISGGVAVVLALVLADNGSVTHTGTDSGSDGIIPTPTESP